MRVPATTGSATSATSVVSVPPSSSTWRDSSALGHGNHVGAIGMQRGGDQPKEAPARARDQRSGTDPIRRCHLEGPFRPGGVGPVACGTARTTGVVAPQLSARNMPATDDFFAVAVAAVGRRDQRLPIRIENGSDDPSIGPRRRVHDHHRKAVLVTGANRGSGGHWSTRPWAGRAAGVRRDTPAADGRVRTRDLDVTSAEQIRAACGGRIPRHPHQQRRWRCTTT